MTPKISTKTGNSNHLILLFVPNAIAVSTPKSTTGIARKLIHAPSILNTRRRSKNTNTVNKTSHIATNILTGTYFFFFANLTAPYESNTLTPANTPPTIMSHAGCQIFATPPTMRYTIVSNATIAAAQMLAALILRLTSPLFICLFSNCSRV